MGKLITNILIFPDGSKVEYIGNDKKHHVYNKPYEHFIMSGYEEHEDFGKFKFREMKISYEKWKKLNKII